MTDINVDSFREKMDRFIDTFRKEYPLSAGIRITWQDKILYRRLVGCADYENQIPLTGDSMFTLYSLSKPFCAIGLMRLKEKGLVDIDRHPGAYVPQARGFDSRVTIRQMLHHTSGLPDFKQTKGFEEQYPYVAGRDMRDYVEKLVDFPMFFEPGCGARYANVNFVICALIIENISGLSYADYMKQEVFDALGMKSAVVGRDGLEVEKQVKGYELREGKILYVGKTGEWMLGAGDIMGTLDDVYCLNKAIKNKLLLKPETWDEILTPAPLNRMGMGCTLTRWHEKHRITHNGGALGFRTYHVQLPKDDLDIILLANFGSGEDIRPKFAEGVYAAFYGADDLESETVEMDKGYIVR